MTNTDIPNNRAVDAADEVNRAKSIVALMLLATDSMTDTREANAVAQGLAEVERYLESAVAILFPEKSDATDAGD